MTGRLGRKARDIQMTLPDVKGLSITDLDGLDGADCREWLEARAPLLVVAEARTHEMRVAVGMYLWKLRLEVGDGAFGQQQAEIARGVGVSERSLRAWRLEAEKSESLPPSTRDLAQRKRQQLRKELPKSGAPAASTPRPKVLEAAASVDLKRVDSKKADPVPPAVRAQPTPPSHPALSETGPVPSVAPGLVPAASPNKVPSTPATVPCPTCRGTGVVRSPASRDRPEVDPATCRHPVMRRRGRECLDCGAYPGVASLALGGKR